MTNRNIALGIPTLHPDQVKAHELKGRFKVVRCGRRWGKTEYGITVAASDAANGKYVGWFAPEYKFIAETYRALAAMLDPIKKAASKDGVYTTQTGGRIDFWSLENELAGRSRKYHRIIIDEGAFTKPKTIDIWRKNLRPTLLDYRGKALVLSNTNGVDPDNFMWQICNQPEHGFVQYHAPTHNNPYLPAAELKKLEAENHPLVYQQEYLAEFVDWAGVAFFAKDALLVNGAPVAFPSICDAVYATIDTATKTGKENDGTGVVYWAVNRSNPAYPALTILDYDLIQIEGAFLETWLPTIFQNLEAFAKQCRARRGSLGAWVEDKASGMVLLQQASRRGWPARAIDSKLTAVGKSERAVSVSGYVYRGMIKFSQQAFDRVVNYKMTSRNHLLSQIVSFRIGDRDLVDDDLLDCFTYGIAIGVGNSEGF
jgi:hypothetical protein